MLIIKKSKIKNAGKGVFASKNIPKNTKLGVYKGKLLDNKQLLRKRNTSYVWQINKKLFVDGSTIVKNNILRFVNGCKTKKQHKKCNVFAYIYDKKIHYKTLRNISQGEELLIDYGEEYW